MSIWDGKVSLSRSLNGPNLFGPCSGALVSMTVSSELSTWLRCSPKPQEYALWGQACQAVLGGNVSVATTLQEQTEIRWVHYLLALNDALRLHYSIEQHPACCLELSDRRILLFVPCDDVQLGLRATATSTTMLFDLLEQVSNCLSPQLAARALELKISRWPKHVAAWRDWAEATALNVNARWIASEAVKRGLPYYRQPGSNTLLQLGHGVYQRRMNGPFTDAINNVSHQWAQDKWQTTALFASHGLPTTESRVVNTAEDALVYARKLGWPVVIKPRSTNKGVGITVNVQSEQTLLNSFEQAARFRAGVLLERHVPGYDHRLLVVGGRFIAGAQRKPAQIEGDGQHTVAELVEALNLARIRSRAPGVYLPHVRIVLDQEALRTLRDAGYGPEDIPPEGMVLSLRGQANLSTGGYAEDVTDQVHADNRDLAEHAARLIGLTTAGLDLQTIDISRSWREVGGAILEINSGPALWVHEPRTSQYNLPKVVLDDLFPNGANGRVLTAGVTGSLGKTSTCRMLAKILECAGHTVALTSTQGSFIGNRQLRAGDLAGGRAALSLLQDPTVTASVAELARGGLIKKGLGFDSLDVGAVLNVQDNHVGLDGITSREQMAQVKQLVVQHANKLAVLNAEDPLCFAMSKAIDTAKLCLVGESIGPRLLAHQQGGGLIATTRDSVEGPLLSLQQGTSIVGEMPMVDIPATWEAKFRPAMVNALFAAALAHGLGIPFSLIRRALMGFASDFSGNPGRMNRISGPPFELWVSLADGPRALEELSTFIEHRYRSISKSLVFCAVGNRPDEFIRASAKAVAGKFDRYYCTEMEEDRRGRPEGEVAELLADSLRQLGLPGPFTAVEASSTSAIQEALRETLPGSVLVIASYHPDKVMTLVRSLWPEAV